MTLVELNEFLTTNQLLVFSLAVPIISALTAAIAAWWSTRRTLISEKERQAHEAVAQISSFRQEWINSLRDSLAEFQSFGVHPKLNAQFEQDFYRLGTKIELLMNPEDQDYEELQMLMYRFLDQSDADILSKYSLNPRFIEVSQRILKREWDRLKDELRNPQKFVAKEAEISTDEPE